MIAAVNSICMKPDTELCTASCVLTVEEALNIGTLFRNMILEKLGHEYTNN